VYNELRTFGKLETKRQMRVKDKEEKATSEVSVDVQTRLVLLKWINSGQLDRVEGETLMWNWHNFKKNI
jgi:serine/threonine-protein kinase RIO1